MNEKCCSYCDYKSINRFNLTRHMQTMHTSKNVIQSEDNPLQCNKCLHIYKMKLMKKQKDIYYIS